MKFGELLMLIIVAVVIFSIMRAARASRDGQVSGRQQRRLSADDLALVKKTSDEDVTQFGEELQRLDAELPATEHDEAVRADYQRALDAYEDAKASVAAMQSADDVSHVTEILGDGRYAVACVKARVAGEPLPTRRPPCFFNPQHGTAVTEVEWTPSGGTSRDVPACALDAERVQAGADPDARTVMVGAQRVPYWNAGRAYEPYAAGYYGASMMPMLFGGMMLGSMLGGGFGDGGYDAGYDQGFDAGQDAGGFDGGGGDLGGGDVGGFDFGGFDF